MSLITKEIPKRFLFDLDETIYTGDLVSVASCELVRQGEQLSKIYTGKDITSFPKMAGIPNCVKEKTIELFGDPYWAAIAKEPLPGAFALLKVLSNTGCEIGTLTARPPSTHEATRYALWRDFPTIKIKAMFANKEGNGGTPVSKLDMIRDWNPDVYFDDHVEYCKQAAKCMKESGQIFLVQNGHTPWNHLENLPAKVKPVKSILDYDVRWMYGRKD